MASATEDAACAAVTFSPSQHMLFDNAKLEPGETVLVQAAGSRHRHACAVKMAKAIGCTVIATRRRPRRTRRGHRARLRPRSELQHRAVRERRPPCSTGKRGVDVVFEHVGASTWAGSMLSMAMGGRLVTCGSTSGVSAETNLMMLFQRQLRLIGSFGSAVRNVGEGLAKMASGITPVIDTLATLDDYGAALHRLESRRVFGKIVLTL
jgi:NADPH:quinone reductase-like Zn-dependent oxidoreductase